MKWIAECAVVSVLTMCGLACDQSEGGGVGSNSANVTVAEQQEAGPVEGTRGVQITPYVSVEIEPNKSIVWCATFAAVWTDLMKVCGGPVQTVPETRLVSNLNQEPLVSGSLPVTGLIRDYGLIGDGVLQRVRRQAAQLRRGDRSELVPVLERALPPDGFALYAYLHRSLKLESALDRLDAMRFAGDPSIVACFGIDAYNPLKPRHQRLAKQIRVLWHRFFRAEGDSDYSQEFIVELLTRAKEDRLILARVDPEASLRATVDRVMNRLKRPNKKSCRKGSPEELNPENIEERSVEDLRKRISTYAGLLVDEDFCVPELKIRARESFNDLLGLRIKSTNQKVGNKPIVVASQRVDFTLNDEGAELESEAAVGIFSSPSRDFTFSKPFLVVLLRKGASFPYLVAWIGNTESMRTMDGL